MFKWLTADRDKGTRAFASVAEGLQSLYKEKLLPIEKDFSFPHFFSPELTDADFSARPMVMLTGQYSTGKSTFIRHLLGRDYPGLRIGPEPTTDKFVAVCKGDMDQVVPGNALVVDKAMPFTQLSHFGNAFLTRFECSKLDSPVLNGMSLIDTPGVLSGEKQRIKRGYEFEEVVKWFADRVDMILVLFDVSKLDISDEFRRVLLALKGNDQKIHIILNKADRVTTPQLMRVYGALMWSLGKVIDTPEVSRVYIGTFWDEPLQNDEQRKLFESEENDLYTALAQMPRSAATRKLNDLIKRARLARVLAFLLNHLRNKMPSFMGKSKEQKRLIDNLAAVYQEIAKEKGLAMGDFPDPSLMREKLEKMDFTKFPKLDKKKMDALERMIHEELPQLLKLTTEEAASAEAASMAQLGTGASPFAVMKVDGKSERTVYQDQWLVFPNLEDYTKEFEDIGPNAARKISGSQAKSVLEQSKLPSKVLHAIWNLSDVDKDGALTLAEFALAKHFIKMKLEGQDLPPTLPAQMIPPPDDRA
ncbi:unnamed protein product [Cladocopium goreaui]|uniref:EH domain-containing protein 1 n=1 Tax=Cladocopium goreaui TaxID=2562237 RepID=A0A9P1C7T4_9DINO|nr:unnamed protein product [Cladocopium goreaui]